MTRGKLRNKMRARRAPRPKDSLVFNGSISIAAAATSSNIGFDYHAVNTNITTGISRNHVAISDSFQSYRYKSLSLEWIPHQGPNGVDAGAVVKVQYITNPEVMYYILVSATATNAENMVKSTDNYHVFNAWERFKWNIPVDKNKRLPWFNADTTFASTVLDLARNTQGLVVVTYQNATTATVILGEFRFNYSIEFFELSSTPGT